MVGLVKLKLEAYKYVMSSRNPIILLCGMITYIYTLCVMDIGCVSLIGYIIFG